MDEKTLFLKLVRRHVHAIEVEVAGVRVAATPSLIPFYDPKSLRIKS